MRKGVVLALILISCIPWIATCGVDDSTSSNDEFQQSSMPLDTVEGSEIDVNSSNSSEIFSSHFNSSSSSSVYSAIGNTSDSTSLSSSLYSSNTTYKIYYYIKTLDGETTTVPDVMRIENGSYPEIYTAGEGTTVSNLINAEYPAFILEFLGWYFDSACTIPFNGVVGPENEGDITLYAQVRKIIK